MFTDKLCQMWSIIGSHVNDINDYYGHSTSVLYGVSYPGGTCVATESKDFSIKSYDR